MLHHICGGVRVEGGGTCVGVVVGGGVFVVRAACSCWWLVLVLDFVLVVEYEQHQAALRLRRWSARHAGMLFIREHDRYPRR